MSLNQLKSDLEKLGSPKKAKHSMRFFKAGKGEYAEGDKFIGVTVPEQRKIAKKYRDLPLKTVEKLLQSPIHEHRLTSLFIMIFQYQARNSNLETRKAIIDLYLKNRNYVNNWDLVDLSAPKLLGSWLEDKNRDILYMLANSGKLWDERISILATYHFIKLGQFEDTLKIAKILLNHKYDLIHKAVGWMLREVGKMDQSVEEEFLKKHYKQMPRTMLRYLIERFEEPLRQRYLKGEI